MIEDMDGNRFLDFTAGIAVTNVGHCHPAGRRGDPQAGGPADPHVGDRLLLHAAGPAGRAAGRAGARARSRSGSSSPTAGPRRSRRRLKLARRHTGRQPRPGVPERLPRPDLRRDVAERARSRCSAAGSRRWSPRSTTPATATSRASTPCSGPSARPTSWRRSSSSRSRARGATSSRPPTSCPGLRRLCDEHGILLVLDEVQTGIGRTGKMFASEHWGVAGDIVCLAKGIANGLPLGAIVARADGDGLAQRQPRLDLRRQPGRLRRGAGDAPAGRDAATAPTPSAAAGELREGLEAWPHRYPVHPRGPRASA